MFQLQSDIRSMIVGGSSLAIAKPKIPLLFDPLDKSFIAFIQSNLIESGLELMNRHGGIGCGIYIRSHLLYSEHSTDYVYRMWITYRYFLTEYSRILNPKLVTRIGDFKRGMSYAAFRRYIYLLKRLGLIQLLDKDDSRRELALEDMELSEEQIIELEKRKLVSIQDIEKTAKEPKIRTTDRNFYTLVLSKLEDQGWVNPQKAVYG